VRQNCNTTSGRLGVDFALGQPIRWILVLSFLCLAFLGNAQTLTVSALVAARGGSMAQSGPKLESLDLNPETVFGGNSSTGTVRINQSAPTGGIAIALASNNAAATVPASVTIAAGSNSATFTVATTAVTARTKVRVTATLGNRKTEAELQVTTLSLQSLSISPKSVTGGNPATGTVTLNAVAPAGGAVVNLTTQSTAVTIPSTVTVSAGQTTGTFSIVTSAVTAQAQAQVSASFGGSSGHASLSILPPTTFSMALNPTSVGGGARSTGTVTLSSAAPSGGLIVNLSSDNAAAFVEPMLEFHSGKTTATFEIQTAGVAASTTATISAAIGSVTETASLTIQPSSLASVTVNPTAVGGGASAWGYVSLNGVAPQGGLAVTLASSLTTVTVPATVTVSSGRSSAMFAITTTSVTSPTVATITATAGAVTQTATLTVNPLGLSSISVDPSNVVGAGTANGSVMLNAPAGTGGVVVALASSDPSATVPTSVTVASGHSKARFTVTTTAVSTATAVTLTATSGAASVTTTLTVNPVGLQAIRLSPERVTGGNTSTGTIRLNGPAPTSGLVVTLASNSTSGTVPASVTVPAGQNAVTFLVQTTAVTKTTQVQITATAGGVTVTANLSVH